MEDATANVAIAPNRPQGAACTARPARAWQFRLQHLFELLTGAAIVSGLATAFGLGSLPLSIGGLMAWLSYRGLFSFVQHGRRQEVVLGLAWITFVTSLALSSFKMFGPVQGIFAAWFALSGPFMQISRGELQLHGLFVLLLIDMANVLIALLPIFVWLHRRGRGQWWPSVLCAAMVPAWCCGWGSQMLSGYYVWSASFAIVLIAFPPSARTLGAMLIVAIATAFYLP
jgi:hypothetical protein